MKTPVQGLHHVTAMAGDPQQNIDFYSTVLGQRLVKVTVNFDDPGTYHLYYGDEVGSPGTVMTSFPWPHASRGRRGNGEAVAIAYAIRSGTTDAWTARLADLGVAHTTSTRFGAETLTFEDPDGLLVELVVDDTTQVPQPWPNTPVPEHLAPHGFHSVTLWVERLDSVEHLLTHHLGFTRVAQEPDPEGTRTRFRGDSDQIGLYLDVVERPGKPRGTFGAGSIHHVALRTRNDSEQAEYLAALKQAGYGVTPVQDRQYFHSIYFRDATGVLFEIATDAPGFAYDEPIDRLGGSLKLPDWYEPRREAIEARVPRVVNREYGVTIPAAPTEQARTEPTPRATVSTPRVQGPHQNQPVLSAGRRPEDARVAVVLVHGRGGTARDILGLAAEFEQTAFAYVAPQASGNTWYPFSFLEPMERNEPGLSSGLSRIADVLDDLERRGIGPDRVILGGFSQGACLVSEFVARNARRYGGVVAFSGGVIGPAGTPRDYAGSLEGTPVFLGCSDVDPHIPLARVEETAAVFERLGASVDKRIYPGMAHTINRDEIDAVRDLMRDLAARSV